MCVEEVKGNPEYAKETSQDAKGNTVNKAQPSDYYFSQKESFYLALARVLDTSLVGLVFYVIKNSKFAVKQKTLHLICRY